MDFKEDRLNLQCAFSLSITKIFFIILMQTKSSTEDKEQLAHQQSQQLVKVEKAQQNTTDISSPLKQQQQSKKNSKNQHKEEPQTPKVQKSKIQQSTTAKKTVASQSSKMHIEIQGNGSKTSYSNLLSPRTKASRDLGWVNQKQKTPGPGQYKTMSCFDKECKSFDFSKAPDRIPVNAYVSPDRWKNPAPGQYQIEKAFEKKGPCYTMSAKTKDNSRVLTQPQNPGPGNYQSSQNFFKNTKGALISPRDTPKYVEFKNKNPGVGEYSINKQSQSDKKGFSMSGKFKDFQKIEPEQTPGPGSYQNSQIMSQQGKYTLSTHKNTLGALISPKNVPKYVQFKNKNPGPGNYKIDNYKEKKSPAFTMSSKYKDFSKVQTEKTPGPGNYNDSEVLSAEGKYKLSTHKSTVGAVISPKQTPKYVQFKNTNPAPGQYNIENYKEKKSPSFSMSQKFEDPFQQKTQQTPGPGNYQDSQVLSPQGKYVLSTHKNSNSVLISPKQTPKYVEFKNTNPGVGQYKIEKEEMGMKGYTTMQNFSKKGFKPTLDIDLSNPGPGYYKTVSDFDKFDSLAKKLKLKKN